MEYLLQIQTYLKESPQVIAALIASVVAIWGIVSQRQLSRQKNSLDFESSYKRNKEIAEANAKVIEIIQSLRQIKKATNDAAFVAEVKKILLDDIDSDADGVDAIKEKRAAVTTVLNEWERAANAVFSNLYDENYLYRAHATSIIQIYTYLRSYIEARQLIVPRYYINFTRLALRWSARRCFEDENQKCTKKLARVLADAQGAGVQFKESKVIESRDGAIALINKAQHDIWLIVNKPGLLRRFLVFVSISKH